MIERIISGGQTGADQAGWRAAKRFGIPTGGWMPKGFKTEDGNRESSNPGIGAWVEEYLCEVFRTMGRKELAK